MEEKVEEEQEEEWRKSRVTGRSITLSGCLWNFCSREWHEKGGRRFIHAGRRQLHGTEVLGTMRNDP